MFRDLTKSHEYGIDESKPPHLQAFGGSLPVEKTSLGGVASAGMSLEPEHGPSSNDDGPSGIIPIPRGLTKSPETRRWPKAGRANERRTSYRLKVGERGLGASSRGARSLKLVDLSASGARVSVHPDEVSAAFSTPLRLQLGADSLVAAPVSPVRATLSKSGDLFYGARLDPLPHSSLVALNRFLIEAFLAGNSPLTRIGDGDDVIETRDPEFVRRLLDRHVVESGAAIGVYRAGRRLNARIEIVARRDAPGACLLALVTGADGIEPEVPHEFVLATKGSLLRFTSAVRETSHGFSILDTPIRLLQYGFRNCHRSVLGARSQVRVRFPHPRFSGATIVRRVDDATVGGISFAIDPREDLLFPGDRLSGMTLHLPDSTLEAAAIVRSISPARGDIYRCGVEFVEFAGTRDERRWSQFAFHAIHPRVVEGGSSAVSDAWNALETSTYVSLWTSEERRERLEASFRRDWGGVESTRGRLFLLREEEESVATCALSRLYPRTWMVHHFGVDIEHRSATRDYAREVYSSFLYAFQHMSEEDYLVIYVEEGKRWNHLMYEQFVARYPHRERLMWTPFDVYRRDATAELPSIVGDAEVVIRPLAKEAEAASMLDRALSMEISLLEREAFSLHIDEIMLSDFEADCRDAGYERVRRVFVASSEDGPQAAIVAESGGEGVNVFGLLNRCWIVPLHASGGSPEVRRQLLRHAVDWYREIDVAEFLYFGQSVECGEAATSLGFERVSGGMRWLSRRDVVPAWMSHVEDVLGGARARGTHA